MEDIPCISINEFKFIKRIGYGSSGFVMLAKSIHSDTFYAAKTYFCLKDNSFQKEMQIYKKIKDYAILSPLGFCLQNNQKNCKIILFTEYMQNGSLDKMIKTNKKFDNSSKYLILLGVALGMKYLHSEGIVHRDLKPANILLNEQMQPKICDFGESYISDEDIAEILMNEYKGTPLYMPPEILKQEKAYNYKCDVYTYAFMAYELITRKSPFYEKHIQNKYQIREVILDKKRPNLSIIQNDYIKFFLSKCWSENPSDRPSFLKIVDEILTDDFKEIFGMNNEKSIQKIEDYLVFFYRVNTYKEILFENNNFIYFSCSSVPQEIIDICLNEFKKLNFVRKFISNVVHQNDPNNIYVFYFLHNFNIMSVNNILNRIFIKNNILFSLPKWNFDIFFDEKMISTNVLKIILELLKNNKYVRRISRNIFDGRQIATYIIVDYFIHDSSKKINQSLQNFLIPKGFVFDKIKYPLENNIILNEKMILKKENDFDFIVKQIKKIKINPINIERNRLYLYGDYFIRKLFQIFTFICFNNENDKMKALNHINSIVYPDMKKVIRYKLNLHYGKIDDSAYPAIVRENLFKIFQSFKGCEDIQEHVFSIENPVERTYVGFDTLKHLKKSYNKFFHYVDILRYGGINPKIFIKKKNLIYLAIQQKLSKQFEYIISNCYSAIDTQINCLEFYGNKFLRNQSKFINVSFFGFDNKDNYTKTCIFLKVSSSSMKLKYYKYHEFKTFLNRISDVPEEYLFYDSL